MTEQTENTAMDQNTFRDIVSNMTPNERTAMGTAMLISLEFGNLMGQVQTDKEQASIVRALFDIHPALEIPSPVKEEIDNILNED